MMSFCSFTYRGIPVRKILDMHRLFELFCDMNLIE